jgi:hypothetical protein
MNKISCLFLSDDIFIINIWDDYKLIGDVKMVDIISTCIKFNSHIYNVNLKKYKGIFITRNSETFEPEYIIVNIFEKKNTIDNITEKVSNISLNLQLNPQLNEYEFIPFLTSLLKDFVFTNITESKKIDYYNSLFSRSISFRGSNAVHNDYWNTLFFIFFFKEF